MAGLMQRRRELIGQYGLPPGYKACNYLQTVGTASNLDTGVAGNDNTLEFDFFVMPLTKGSYSSVFGNYTSESTKCYRLIHAAASNANAFIVSTNQRQSAYSSTIMITGIDTIAEKIFRCHLEYMHAYIEYNGTKYPTPALVTDDSEVSTRNICIGNVYPSNGSTSASNPTHRFYKYFKIRKDEKLIRDYRPCTRESDSKAGFYDLVNRTFNPSTGSADFIAGQ